MLRIGLTGGIGSGKSTVASEFEHLGISVFDLDQIAREIVLPGTPALRQIVGRFGAQILNSNNELDRGKLREIVFADADERRWLPEFVPAVVSSSPS